MSPILFFDIDGCLHPHAQPKLNSTGKITRSPDDGLFCWSDKLITILQRHEDLNLVCHSNWRRHYSLDELLEQLPAEIATKTVGVTEKDIERYQSILKYAQENHIQDYLIMDDDLWAFPNKLPQLVWLPEDKGLSLEASATHLEERVGHLCASQEKRPILKP